MTCQVMLPIRVRSLRDCVGLILGSPGGMCLLLPLTTPLASLDGSSVLEAFLPAQSPANGAHMNMGCQTNLGRPSHSLPGALRILWN